ncbi:MAG: UDP-N-acetylmuramate--L-alanine ligase [Bacteroidales bacterium]|jgi:UDP-N-acetylglucosamine--N-acetylmuramyl-(pentapeptide) pyrophosphoryl-undecaprenol N-acetylglucosamine transferase|nr:UDP-N-acetylmuramate--L-alanine ligase [Bacteroidales bacterium]
MFRIIISGGGTGGHIFPAVAIGQSIRNEMPNAEILFVGAKGRMEMEKIPQAGFNIVGLPVAGINRKQIWKNFSLPFKLVACFYKARRIIKTFKPNVVVGVGGYASAPVLWTAERMNIPCLIQEQNSYPGVTNLSLARKAERICVAYTGMEKYFPKNKIVLTGNPVRQDISGNADIRSEAIKFYGLEENKKTILVIGGSLGARTLNDGMSASIDTFLASGYQVLWQTGKIYYDKISQSLQGKNLKGLVVLDFIKNMNFAYSVADIIISRAGALSISELSIVGKPVILVPSPNVAENHQWKNAMALVEKNAAIMIEDKDAIRDICGVASGLLEDEEKQKQLSRNILLMAKPNATSEILKEVLSIARAKKIYFLGTGGIGMSALARYFMLKGVEVFGYDRVCTPLTQQLEKEGVVIHYEENPQKIPADIDEVIYTPAIPSDNLEWNYLRSLGVPIKKRAVVLGEISRKYKTIAVAGTHGKTSTATMTAFLLKDRVAFLGGISNNFNSNFLYSKNAKFCVAEADEYDRSFLELHPEYSIITSADDDHLDIYKTSDEVKKAFSKFANLTKGLLVVKTGLEKILNLENVCTYSLQSSEDSCAFARNVKIENGNYCFDYVCKDEVISGLSLRGSGEYNVENAIAAITIALKTGVSASDIKKSLPLFTGVKRRFDVRVKKSDIVYADDYAHHPKEIETSIRSFKKLYPEYFLLLVFQPHLYSRTRDFAEDFAKSLSLADELVLLDIYPARELPIEDISSKTIGQYVSKIPLQYETKENLLAFLQTRLDKESRPVLLVTMGAGDIDTLVAPIENFTAKK